MADPEPNDARDRLVDMLLWETLGGQEPPNLMARILRQADASERARKFKLVFTVTAAAAMVGLAISGYLWITRPPEPTVVKEVPPEVKKTDEAKTEPPKKEEPKIDEWARGSLVQTGDKAKSGVLGGYAKVEAAPNTSLKVEGKEKAEQIVLEKGQVVCEVDKKMGSFTVRTPAGQVYVTGTRFKVEVPRVDDGERHGEGPRTQQMKLSVTEGSVQLAGEYERVVFEAGESGGSVLGTVVNKGEDAIFVKSDGDRDPVRYVPQMVENHVDRAMMEKFRDAAKDGRVQFAYKTVKGDGGRELRRVVRMYVIDRAPRSGKFQGVIQERGEEWIRVKNDDGKSERFAPRWIGGQPHQGGGLDKEILAKMNHLRQGDRVKIDWELNEGMRIVRIDKLEKEGD